MKCGECNLNDGLCYASNPPQVKCTITGEFHMHDHECDALVTATTMNPQYCTSCLVCDEVIELYDHPAPSVPKICDKCKTAIMAMRRNLNI